MHVMIDYCHRSICIMILLQNYYSSKQLKKALAQFVEYYANERYHESLLFPHPSSNIARVMKRCHWVVIDPIHNKSG